jgi:hypothetical protein
MAGRQAARLWEKTSSRNKRRKFVMFPCAEEHGGIWQIGLGGCHLNGEAGTYSRGWAGRD